ncbi:hypothetical protein SPHINGOR109_30114 [Sphingorhabdus sp. 109]|nr:hypothetical protein SPHINGOR109_30114 [Sphingorhabdus sp. 109]
MNVVNTDSVDTSLCAKCTVRNTGFGQEKYARRGLENVTVDVSAMSRTRQEQAPGFNLGDRTADTRCDR